jgi:hypothetical protein
MAGCIEILMPNKISNSRDVLLPALLLPRFSGFAR